MQGDSVEIFKRFVAARLQVERQGPTVSRMLNISALSLGLGQPDKAFQWAQEVLDLPGCVPADADRALHLGVVAHCLKAAILEGDAAGAPGAVQMNLDPKEFRKMARNLLEAKASLDIDEQILLRKLRGNFGLGYITTHISSLMKDIAR